MNVRSVEARLVLWATGIAIVSATQYYGRIALGPPPKDVLYRWDNAWGSIAQYAVFLAFALALAWRHRELLAWRRPGNVHGAFRIAILVLLAVYVVSAVVGAFADPGKEQGLTPTSLDHSRLAPFAANALVVCVVAPFVEETLFRGVGFSLVAARWGVEPAIVATAIAFGLYHGLFQGLPILVAFGIGLAWLRDRTGSVVPGMLLHGTFNAIALVAALAT